MLSNLDNIINKIMSDSNEKIEALSKEMEEKKDQLREEFDKDLRLEKEHLNKKFEMTRELDLERIGSSSELKARHILLEQKQSLIELSIAKLKESLNNISSDEMLAYINDKLASRKQKHEGEVIVLPAKYSDLKDKISNLEFCDKVVNGFVIKYKGIEENYTFDSIINYKQDELEGIIQKYFE